MKNGTIIIVDDNKGVLVLNSQGVVHQKNCEALKLIGLDVLTHVS